MTVTFCVNLTMIQDKASGARKDFDVSPVHRPTLYIGYFCSTVLNSLMVNFLAVVMCLIYEAYGMVSEWNRYCLDYSGCDSVSIIWRSAVSIISLSAEDGDSRQQSERS